MEESKKIKIYFPNKDHVGFESFLQGLFPGKEIEYVKNWKDTRLNLIVFTGGEDVSPSMYGENTGKYTHTNAKRDQKESDDYHSIYYGTPRLGICRGAQFLTVMNGGKLIQHVEGHKGCLDTIETYVPGSGKYVIKVPSDHHQMMFPYNLSKDRYEILGHSEYFKSNTYLNGDNQEIELPDNFLEPEIIYYPQHNSLAIQSHPEWITDSNDTSLKVIYTLIKNKLFKN